MGSNLLWSQDLAGVEVTARYYPSFKEFRSSSPVASHRMSLNRREGGRAEQVLGAELRRLNVRFSSQPVELIGRPDFVFHEARVCLFCDGDFWHGRDWGRLKPQLSRGKNPGYWLAKIAANRSRDQLVNRKLRAAGWKVWRVWETDVLRDVESTAKRVTHRLAHI